MKNEIYKSGVSPAGGYGNLDLIKMPLALLIVFRHIGQKFCFEDVYWRCFVNTISTIGVTSFFIISGFLFFKKPADEVRLKKQVLRILKLYICWSLIYSPVIIYRYLKAGIAFPQAIVDFIQKFLFSGSYYHLWYLPSLIVAIYIVYILREKNSVLMAVTAALMIIGIITDTYQWLLPQKIRKLYSIYSGVFLTSRNGLFMGSFLVAMGKIFADYEEKLKNVHWWKIMLPFSAIALFVEGLWICGLKNSQVVNIAFSTVLVASLLVAQMIGSPQMSASWQARSVSTIMYLCHPWVLAIVELLGNKVIILKTEMKVVICVIATVLIALSVVLASKKIKILRVLM